MKKSSLVFVLALCFALALILGFETSATASDYSIGSEKQAGGLVGYWSFDEGSGSTASDSSGNGNNGTIYGASWVDGKSGKALSFDGANDYIQVSHSSSLMPSQVSVEAWIYPHSYTTQWARILEKGGWQVGGGYGMEFNGGGEQKIALITWGESTAYGHYSDVTIPLNQWSHVAGTFDGSYVRNYVNGTLAGTTSATMTSNTAQLTIGKWAGGSEYFFDGVIDEVRIYNRALSASEVLADYQAGATDNDGDGIPNTWETQYGLNPNFNDASQDADGDGYTNLQEYQAGTDPKSASSYPGAAEVAVSPKGIPIIYVVAAIVAAIGCIGGAIAFMNARRRAPRPKMPARVPPPGKKPPVMKAPPKLSPAQIESRVYEYIKRHRGELDPGRCAEELGLSEREVGMAVEVLKAKGKVAEE